MPDGDKVLLISDNKKGATTVIATEPRPIKEEVNKILKELDVPLNQEEYLNEECDDFFRNDPPLQKDNLIMRAFREKFSQ